MAEALNDWHDFYVLLGGAAATLVGLTFVAASIGVGVLSRDHEAGMKVFVTPTVTHFSAILIACLLDLAPLASATSLAALLLAEGVAGIAYSLRVWLHIRSREFTADLVLVDRVWYALAPVAAYAVLAGGAVALMVGAKPSRAVLAVGLGLLLFAGIRNAWDMAQWFVMRPRG